MSSNKRRVIGLAALLFFATWNASAAGHLKVTLSQPGDKNEAEVGIVTVTFENTGDQPVSMLRWKTPFEINDDRLGNPQFTVLDSLGQPMPYIGRNVKYGGMSPNSFMTLQPHQVVSKNIDVGSDHGLKEGEYTVRYSIDLTTRPEIDAPDGTKANSVPINSQKEARSNELKIWVTPALLAAKKLKTTLADRTTAQSFVCESPQIDKLGGVLSSAASASLAAMNHLSSTYQWTFNENGLPTGVNNTDPRYVYWFGTYDTSIPISDPSSINSDNAQVDQIMAAIYYRAAYESFSFECGCDPDKYSPETRAWAESGNPYRMHICDSFWNDSLTGWPASQTGTMLHEISHFSDALHGPTFDYAYDFSKATL